MGWRITGPDMSVADQNMATTYTGEPVDTSKLLGPRTPNSERVFRPDPMFAALQLKGVRLYEGPVPSGARAGRRLTVEKITKRRARNRMARLSRQVNRSAR